MVRPIRTRGIFFIFNNARKIAATGLILMRRVALSALVVRNLSQSDDASTVAIAGRKSAGGGDADQKARRRPVGAARGEGDVPVALVGRL